MPAHDLSEFVDVAGKAIVGLGAVVKVVKEVAKRLAEAKPQEDEADDAYVKHLEAEVEQWKGMYFRVLDKYESWTARDRGVQLAREEDDQADEATGGAADPP